MADFFVKKELLPVTNYVPDIDAIKKNRVKVFLGAGRESLDRKRFHAQTAPLLTNSIGCEMVIFPGHYVSYVDVPDQWAATLRRVLHKASDLIG
jgi:hypothetical protein